MVRAATSSSPLSRAFKTASENTSASRKSIESRAPAVLMPRKLEADMENLDRPPKDTRLLAEVFARRNGDPAGPSSLSGVRTEERTSESIEMLDIVKSDEGGATGSL